MVCLGNFTWVIVQRLPSTIKGSLLYVTNRKARFMLSIYRSGSCIGGGGHTLVDFCTFFEEALNHHCVNLK